MKVWDLPIRLFHWLLAALVVFSWWAHEDHLDWHRLSGFAIAGLLVFRFWWGLAGSSTARFSGFLKSPAGVLAYLRGAAPGPGHNPLGGWSVVAMLALTEREIRGSFVNCSRGEVASGRWKSTPCAAASHSIPRMVAVLSAISARRRPA